MSEIRNADVIKAGIALRSYGPLAMVHPYTFRQVCSNGAIMARTTGAQMVRRWFEWEDGYDEQQAREELRQAVRMCDKRRNCNLGPPDGGNQLNSLVIEGGAN